MGGGAGITMMDPVVGGGVGAGAIGAGGATTLVVVDASVTVAGGGDGATGCEATGCGVDVGAAATDLAGTASSRSSYRSRQRRVS
jgi:hypothetical protein